MKICTIVGTRPQFIKASALSNELRKSHEEILIHTGQHYDKALSKVFFEQLKLPRPNYYLNVGSGTHGKQTGLALIEIETILLREKPDLVIVYGDCNATLSGALAAVKLHIPLAHIEAGCRSFDRRMPEEYNRLITDHISDILFCATENNAKQLSKENITKDVHVVGDIMYDAVLAHSKTSTKSDILERLGLGEKEYVLVTVHRPENTNSVENMKQIVAALIDSGEPTVFSMHPRTKSFLLRYKLLNCLRSAGNIILMPSLNYVDFQKLEMCSSKILTDSGGVQKEAYYFKVPCITLRKNTEWVETVKDGWNYIANANYDRILNSVRTFNPIGSQTSAFGLGDSAKKIVEIISKW